jgi:hypothetical protein
MRLRVVSDHFNFESKERTLWRLSFSLQGSLNYYSSGSYTSPNMGLFNVSNEQATSFSNVTIQYFHVNVAVHFGINMSQNTLKKKE